MNYRERMRKGECLLNAILWTIIPVFELFLFFYTDINSQLDLKSTWFAILSLVLQAAASAFHWYRYLAYDKKVVKDE